MEPFQADILICATAYVRARDEQEALRLIAEAYGSAGEPGELFVKDLPAGRGVRLSPVMTVYGAWSDWTIERAGCGNEHAPPCPACGSKHRPQG